MKILIVTEAWHPQINGVVRSLETTKRELEKLGHSVRVISPDTTSWRTWSLPSYAEIKLEFFGRSRIRREVEDFQPDLIHIATEGPLGWSARNLCLQQKRPFTTSYHTRFPEYLAARVPRFMARLARVVSYMVVRRFHAPSNAIMVATPSIEKDLQRRHFYNLVRWSRGVDREQFQPHGKNLPAYAHLKRPILLYVGRVAVEKNLRAFLDLETTGSKVVIGNGPDLDMLKAEYPAAHFLGAMEGKTLGQHYAAADLFVFPSKTDTFGLVLLEACAAGLRVAAYPVPGPVDIFADPSARTFAALDDDLQKAVDTALALPDNLSLPRQFTEAYSWSACTKEFFGHLSSQGTPRARKRIVRLGRWLSRWAQHALALAFK